MAKPVVNAEEFTEIGDTHSEICTITCSCFSLIVEEVLTYVQVFKKHISVSSSVKAE